MLWDSVYMGLHTYQYLGVIFFVFSSHYNLPVFMKSHVCLINAQ